MKVTVTNPAIEGSSYPEYEPEDKEIGRRTITVDGKEFIIVATDPYGFYKVKKALGGKVPGELAGSYTSVHEATVAIKSYVGKQKE